MARTDVTIATIQELKLLTNQELVKNLKVMQKALEDGKKSTWNYAIALNNIVADEQFADDFTDKKKFAQYIGKSPAYISQVCNGVAFASATDMIGKITLGKAYMLSTVDYEQFKKFCESKKLNIIEMSDGATKKAVHDFNALLIPEKKEEQEEQEEQEVQEQEEQEVQEDEEVRLSKDEAIELVKKLMAKYDLTIEDLK